MLLVGGSRKFVSDSAQRDAKDQTGGRDNYSFFLLRLRVAPRRTAIVPLPISPARRDGVPAFANYANSRETAFLTTDFCGCANFREQEGLGERRCVTIAWKQAGCVPTEECMVGVLLFWAIFLLSLGGAAIAWVQWSSSQINRFQLPKWRSILAFTALCAATLQLIVLVPNLSGPGEIIQDPLLGRSLNCDGEAGHA
jgi:hypothetical protein